MRSNHWLTATLITVAMVVALFRFPIAGSAFSATTSALGSVFATAANFNVGPLFAWGDNSTEQIGPTGWGGQYGSKEPSPVQVGTDTSWVHVATSNQPARDADTGHTCAIRADDTLWCWGRNFFGQLGTGNSTNYDTPRQIAGSWRTVATGGMHTCGIKTDGTLWCWGQNSYGQLGHGNFNDRDTPGQVGTSGMWGLPSYSNGWTALDAGNVSTCGIDGGQLYCWGEGLAYHLGNNNTNNQSRPDLISSNSSHTSVTVGRQHACALRSDGSAWCWGAQGFYFGQTGTGNWESTPDQVDRYGPENWTQVIAGRDSTCGIRSPGTLWCWGLNDNYELGLGYTSDRSTPTQVGSANDWKRVSVGNEFACANRVDKTIYCWGDNGYGQLGQGDYNRETTPQLVPGRTGTVYTGGTGSHTTYAIG